MYNENLYNESLYNEIDYKPTSYDKEKTAIDFGNGFILPFSGCNAFNFTYLDSREVKYSTSRLTDSTLQTYNIKQNKGVLLIEGTLEANNRAELLDQIHEMKSKIFGKLENVRIKDGGKEFINDFTEVKVSFDDNFYNNTWVDFKITLDFYKNLEENRIRKSIYKGITESPKEFTFYNEGEETDFKLIFTVNSGNNNYSIFLNDILILSEDLVAGDTLFIDSKKIEVLKNNNPLVFSGIISKMIKNKNTLKVLDNGTARDYDLTFKYRKSFN